MKNAVSINGQGVSFEVVNGQTFTTSLDIASVFEKRHDNTIAQIKALPQDKFNALNFKAVKYQDQKGEFRPMYKITKDGFSLLVMGFTGTKAYYWKIEFINAFNKMEQMLKDTLSKPRPKLDNLVGDFGVLQQKLTEVKSEANTFRQKYYEALERENRLLHAKHPSYILPMPRYSEDEETIVLTKAKGEERFYVGTGNALRPEEIEAIMELYFKGVPQTAIAKTIGRSKSAVGRCVRRHR